MGLHGRRTYRTRTVAPRSGCTKRLPGPTLAQSANGDVSRPHRHLSGSARCHGGGLGGKQVAKASALIMYGRGCDGRGGRTEETYRATCRKMPLRRGRPTSAPPRSCALLAPLARPEGARPLGHAPRATAPPATWLGPKGRKEGSAGGLNSNSKLRIANLRIDASSPILSKTEIDDSGSSMTETIS